MTTARSSLSNGASPAPSPPPSDPQSAVSDLLSFDDDDDDSTADVAVTGSDEAGESATLWKVASVTALSAPSASPSAGDTVTALVGRPPPTGPFPPLALTLTPPEGFPTPVAALTPTSSSPPFPVPAGLNPFSVLSAAGGSGGGGSGKFEAASFRTSRTAAAASPTDGTTFGSRLAGVTPLPLSLTREPSSVVPTATASSSAAAAAAAVGAGAGAAATGTPAGTAAAGPLLLRRQAENLPRTPRPRLDDASSPSSFSSCPLASFIEDVSVPSGSSGDGVGVAVAVTPPLVFPAIARRRGTQTGGERCETPEERARKGAEAARKGQGVGHPSHSSRVSLSPPIHATNK